MRNIKNIHIIKIDKKNHKYVKKTLKKIIKQVIIHIIKFFYFHLFSTYPKLLNLIYLLFLFSHLIFSMSSIFFASYSFHVLLCKTINLKNVKEKVDEF